MQPSEADFSQSAVPNTPGRVRTPRATIRSSVQPYRTRPSSSSGAFCDLSVTAHKPSKPPPMPRIASRTTCIEITDSEDERDSQRTTTPLSRSPSLELLSTPMMGNRFTVWLFSKVCARAMDLDLVCKDGLIVTFSNMNLRKPFISSLFRAPKP